MRLKIVTSLLLLAVNTLFAQQVELVQSRLLTLGDKAFSAPQFSPDGNKLLFTQNGYKGLWLYDLGDDTLVQLNDYTGAGYEPVFADDGEQIVFRVDDYSGRRKKSAMMTQRLSDKEPAVIVQNVRDLYPPQALNRETVVYRIDDRLNYYNISQKSVMKSNTTNAAYAYADYQKIVIVENDQRKVLSPAGKGNYIWVSLSPDNTRLLFKLVGAGAYISDLDGNLLVDLGMANAAKWSPDGQWIVYMKDEDDGHRMTASEIWVCSSDGAKHFQLTHTKDLIEMYPDWSPGMDKIVFDTDDGQIGLLEIRISE